MKYNKCAKIYATVIQMFVSAILTGGYWVKSD